MFLMVKVVQECDTTQTWILDFVSLEIKSCSR